MERKITHKLNVGDKVTFGCYGYFDIQVPYTIIEVKDTLPMFGNYEYVIEDDNGHKITAYSDEILPL